LLRFLFSDPWFRIAICGLAGLVLSLASLGPRIWKGSPPGFEPVIRVSGLDLAQGWSLRRTASKATAAGRFEEANHAWLAALARNPGDAEAARGGLRNYLRSDRKRSGLAGHYGGWLLKLTGTNRADLELVAQVLEKHEEPDLLLSLLEPRKDQLSPSLETTYLKALFHCRKIADFAARWKRARNELPWNEDLALFEAALRAGWESGAEAAQGREQLESGLERPPERLLAGRLLLTASAQRLDADRYGWVLGRLQE
jgi:hypothetical protein